MKSRFPTEPSTGDFLREHGSFVPANTQKPVKIGGTVMGPNLSLRSGNSSPSDIVRQQSKEKGAQIYRRRAVAALAISGAAVAGGALLANNLSSDDAKPKPAPVTTELETVGTTIPLVDEQGEGVVELVGEEADASNVQIDWKTTQSLVEKARELNEGEPRFGEPYILPDIPNAEPTSPVAPTTAP